MRFDLKTITLAAALLPGVTLAQTSSYCVPIGISGAVGCQSPLAPTLTFSVAATGLIDFQYDQSTGILTLVVSNNSPIIAGEQNPLMTEIAWNFPVGITGAALVAQTGSGGLAPNFWLYQSQTQPFGLSCLGNFEAGLCVSSPGTGIGNGNAPSSTSNPNVTLGPVTFTLQLTGPGVGTTTAQAIGTELSQNGNPSVAVGTTFENGGIGGIANGHVSNGTPCCPSAATSQAYGTGCAPTGFTIPSMSCPYPPVLAGPIAVDVSSPSTPSSAGVLLLGFNSTFSPVFNMPLPLNLTPYGFSGCSLYSSGHFLITLLTDGNGDASFTTTPVPGVSQKWCGAQLTFQTFFLASNGGLINSPGLSAIVGS